MSYFVIGKLNYDGTIKATFCGNEQSHIAVRDILLKKYNNDAAIDKLLDIGVLVLDFKVSEDFYKGEIDGYIYQLPKTFGADVSLQYVIDDMFSYFYNYFFDSSEKKGYLFLLNRDTITALDLESEKNVGYALRDDYQ